MYTHVQSTFTPITMNPLAFLVSVIAVITAPQLTQTDDVGLIGYFEEGCPEGWEEYDKLAGRVPIGAGAYIGVAEDGRTESVTYLEGTTGGEVLHTQTVEEIASHKHITATYGGYSTNTGLSSTGNGMPSLGAYSWETGQLYCSEEGKDQPHNNMPPYLVLTACQKTTSHSYASQSDLDSAESDITSLQSSVTTMQSSLSNYASQSDLDPAESDITNLQSSVTTMQSSLSNYASQSDVSVLQSQVNSLESDACTITCPASTSHDTTTALSAVGITTGILGMVFGCLGTALGLTTLYNNRSRTSRVATIEY